MAFDPQAVNTQLGKVGDSHITTGNKLVESAAELRTMAATLNENERIDRALGSIETGMRSTRDLLAPVATSLHSVATALSNITVPSIQFDRRELDLGPAGIFRVVTGISISSTRPLRAIGTSVESVADDIDNIRTGLRDTASAADTLQDELPRIRTRLLSGADDLEQAGGELVGAGRAIQDVGHLLAQ